jgi:hypothetical protein
MKQNLKKKRLARSDPAWVEHCLTRLEGSTNQAAANPKSFG